MQPRYKKLLGNTIIFSISGFASKLLIFFLLPLYTSYYTPEEYGYIDLCMTIINLALPILTLQISSAVLRFVMEKSQDATHFFSIGLIVVLAGIAFSFAVFPPVLHVLHLDNYYALVFIMYVMYALDELFGNYARSVDAVLLVGICGVVKASCVMLLSMFLLLGLNLGIDGYLLAYDIAFAATNTIFFLKLRLWRLIHFRNLSMTTAKEMLAYAVPLIPNSIAWWLNTYASRLIIIWGLGSSSLGYFAAANKMPSIITSVQSFIAQALTLSVFDEYDGDERTRNTFYSELFELYGAMMCLICSVTVLLTPLLAHVLFQGEFYEAWKYVPVLLVGTAFGAHTGYLGTFYTASKKTIGMFTTTLAGCLLNIVVSFLSILAVGLEGVSVAYLLSQILIYILRMRDSRNLTSLVVSRRVSILGYVILVAQCLFAWFIELGILFYIIQAIFFVILGCVYRNQIALGRKLLFNH